MTTRLPAATHSERPILLRTISTARHGINTALNVGTDQDADVFSFLFDQLDVK
jgi:prolyl oligopeptidase